MNVDDVYDAIGYANYTIIITKIDSEYFGYNFAGPDKIEFDRMIPKSQIRKFKLNQKLTDLQTIKRIIK